MIGLVLFLVYCFAADVRSISQYTNSLTIQLWPHSADLTVRNPSKDDIETLSGKDNVEGPSILGTLSPTTTSPLKPIEVRDNSDGNQSNHTNHSWSSLETHHHHHRHPQISLVPTIVVQTKGELGNHLSVMAHAYGIQLELRRTYGIETNLLFRHQTLPNGRTVPKGKETRLSLQRCFPHLRSIDFSLVNAITKEWELRKYQLQKLYSDEERKRLDGINTATDLTDLTQSLSYFANEVTNATKQQLLSSWITTSSSSSSSSSSDNVSISLPFLYSHSMGVNNIMINKYYEEIREWLQFDSNACCKALPDPDEVVWVRFIVIVTVSDFVYYLIEHHHEHHHEQHKGQYFFRFLPLS